MFLYAGPLLKEGDYFMNLSEGIDLLLCLTIMAVFIYGWGKVKTKIALNRFAKGKKYIAEKDYRGAVKQLEDLGGELKNDPDYWFYLGLALAGAGSAAARAR